MIRNSFSQEEFDCSLERGKLIGNTVAAQNSKFPKPQWNSEMGLFIFIAVKTDLMGTKKYSGWDNSCVCNGLCENSHTVWVVKNDATSTPIPRHVPSPAVISLHAPDRTHHFTPECPIGHERSSMAYLTLTPEPAMELDPEPTPPRTTCKSHLHPQGQALPMCLS